LHNTANFIYYSTICIQYIFLKGYCSTGNDIESNNERMCSLYSYSDSIAGFILHYSGTYFMASKAINELIKKLFSAISSFIIMTYRVFQKA